MDNYEKKKKQLEYEIKQFRNKLSTTTRRTNGKVRQEYLDEIHIREEEINRLDYEERQKTMKVTHVNAPTGNSSIGGNTSKSGRHILSDGDMAAQFKI